MAGLTLSVEQAESSDKGDDSMRICLSGDELNGIADRLMPRLAAAVKKTIRASTDRRASGEDSVVELKALTRGLADLLAPVVCPEDTLLTASQAQALMGIRKSKWHELRNEGRVPDPVPTICGDRWYRSAILGCLAAQAAGCEKAGSDTDAAGEA